MINFFSKEVPYLLSNEEIVSTWIAQVAKQYGSHIEELNYIFCSDTYLLELNKEHLDHDYYTDILTFPYQQKPIMGDIYISVDRVKDNARTFGVLFDHEMNRVMAHGLLHLLGFDDQTEQDKKEMRAKEDESVEILNTLLDTN